MSSHEGYGRHGSSARGFVMLRLAQYGLLFVSALLVARALGPEDRARYALPLALAAGVASLLHLSLEGARRRTDAR